MGKAYPRLKKGEEVLVRWVDITEDSNASDDIEPYVFETGARFVKWRSSKAYGRVLFLSATFAVSHGHEGEYYGVLAIPKGCILSLEKREKEQPPNAEPRTDS